MFYESQWGFRYKVILRLNDKFRSRWILYQGGFFAPWIISGERDIQDILSDWLMLIYLAIHNIGLIISWHLYTFLAFLAQAQKSSKDLKESYLTNPWNYILKVSSHLGLDNISLLCVHFVSHVIWSGFINQSQAVWNVVRDYLPWKRSGYHTFPIDVSELLCLHYFIN